MAGEITQLTPQGIGPYFVIPAKTDSGVVDKGTVSDIVVPVLSEGLPFDLEQEIYDYVTPRLVESAVVVRIPPVQTDICIPRLVETVFPPVVITPPAPPLVVTTADTVVPVLVDNVAIIAEPVNASDTCVPVLVEVATLVAPELKTPTDTVVPVLFEFTQVNPFLPFEAFDVEDTVVPVLSEFYDANVRGDIDAIAISSRPYGHIDISEV